MKLIYEPAPKCSGSGIVQRLDSAVEAVAETEDSESQSRTRLEALVGWQTQLLLFLLASYQNRAHSRFLQQLMASPSSRSRDI